MRDPKQIGRLLAKIEMLWERYPDQRLCQLLVNVNDLAYKLDLSYYLEDEKLDNLLDRALENGLPPS